MFIKWMGSLYLLIANLRGESNCKQKMGSEHEIGKADIFKLLQGDKSSTRFLKNLSALKKIVNILIHLE